METNQEEEEFQKKSILQKVDSALIYVSLGGNKEGKEGLYIIIALKCQNDMCKGNCRCFFWEISRLLCWKGKTAKEGVNKLFE